MARPTKNLTLSPDSIEYLSNFPNQSRTVDEALELHKNKDKVIIKNIQPSELKKVVLEI